MAAAILRALINFGGWPIGRPIDTQIKYLPINKKRFFLLFAYFALRMIRFYATNEKYIPIILTESRESTDSKYTRLDDNNK